MADAAWSGGHSGQVSLSESSLDDRLALEIYRPMMDWTD
jgi:hypothetical protein